MSRAFVKEHVDEPEPSGRTRSRSGLPPGALNYLTARGAQSLRDKAESFRHAGDAAAAAEIEALVASATIVEPPAAPPASVMFGATVTVCAADGLVHAFRVVGVDEVDLEKENVSWVSSLGRALLGAERGGKVALDGGRPTATVVEIEHR
jgi:transcription elongation GreA/GreB family factor